MNHPCVGKHLRFLLFAFLISFTAFAQPSASSEDELKKQAEKAFIGEKYNDALSPYSQLLSLYPRNATYNYRYGVSLLKAGKNKTNAVSYLEAAAKDPANPEEVWIFLGQAYMIIGKFDDALGSFRKFEAIANSAKFKKFNSEELKANCMNAIELLKSRKNITIVSTKEVSVNEFYKFFSWSNANGKIVPAAEQFLTAMDKDKQLDPVMFIANDKQTIYISSYGKKGERGKDLYIIRKMPNGQWSEAENLGETINSVANEDFPYLDRDGRTLYFSSKSQKSIGGYDIFSSKFDFNTGKWATPENLGWPINTISDDYLYVPISGQTEAFYATGINTSKNEIEIRRIQLMDQGEALVTISGYYAPTDQKVRRDARITILRGDGQGIITSVYTDPYTGKYDVTLEPGREYIIVVEGGGYLPHSENFSLPSRLNNSELKQVVKVTREKSNENLTIENYFYPASAVRNEPSEVKSAYYDTSPDTSSLMAVQINNQTVMVTKPGSGKQVNSAEPVLSSDNLVTIEKKDEYDPTLLKGPNADEIKQKKEEEIRTKELSNDNKKSDNYDITIGNEELATIAILDAKTARDEADSLKVEVERLKVGAMERDNLSAQAMTKAENASELDKPSYLNEAYTMKADADNMRRQAADLSVAAIAKNSEAKASEEEAALLSASINDGKSKKWAKSSLKENNTKVKSDSIDSGIAQNNSNEDGVNHKTNVDSNVAVIEVSNRKSKDSNDSITKIDKVNSESAQEVNSGIKNSETSEPLKTNDKRIASEAKLIPGELSTSSDSIQKENRKPSVEGNKKELVGKSFEDKTQSEIGSMTKSESDETISSKNDIPVVLNDTTSPGNVESAQLFQDSIAASEQDEIITQNIPGVNVQTKKVATSTDTISLQQITEAEQKIMEDRKTENTVKENSKDQPLVSGNNVESVSGNNVESVSGNQMPSIKKGDDVKSVPFDQKSIDQNTEVNNSFGNENKDTGIKNPKNATDTKEVAITSGRENKSAEEKDLANVNVEKVSKESDTLNEISNPDIHTQDVIISSTDSVSKFELKTPFIVPVEEVKPFPADINTLKVNPVSEEARIAYQAFKTKNKNAKLLSDQSIDIQNRIVNSKDSPEKDSLIFISNNLTDQATAMYADGQEQLVLAQAIDPEVKNKMEVNEQIVAYNSSMPTNSANNNLSPTLNKPESQKAETVDETKTDSLGQTIISSSTENADEIAEKASTEIARENSSENITENSAVINDYELSTEEAKAVDEVTTFTVETPNGKEVVKIDTVGINTRHPEFNKYVEVNKEITSKQVETIDVFADAVNQQKRAVDQKQEQNRLMDKAEVEQDRPTKAQIFIQADAFRDSSKKNEEEAAAKFAVAQSKTAEVKNKTAEMQEIRQRIAIPGRELPKQATNSKINHEGLTEEEIAAMSQPKDNDKPGRENFIIEETSTPLFPATVIAYDKVQEFAKQSFSIASSPVYSKVNPIPMNPPIPDGLVFKVQIGAFRNEIPAEKFSGVQPIAAETTRPGWVRYCVGLFQTFEPAVVVKKEMQQRGFKDAFVVAYLNGKRIGLDEAYALIGKGKAKPDNNYIANSQTEMALLRANNIRPENISSIRNNIIDSDEKSFYGLNASNVKKSLAIVEYAVQVGVYKTQTIPRGLQSLSPLFTERIKNNLYRFTSDHFVNYATADSMKRIARREGVKDAFIVVYRNGVQSALSSVPMAERTLRNSPDLSVRTSSTSATESKTSESKAEESKDVVNTSSTTSPSTLISKEKIIYRVQLGAFKNNIPFTAVVNFLNVADKGITQQTDERGLHIFYAGKLERFSEAATLRAEIVAKGVTDAFVVALQAGKRVVLTDDMKKE